MFALRVLISFGLILLISYSPLAQQRQDHKSAWDSLIQQNPTVVDDPQVSWKDRLILYALSPGQAQDYYRGTDPNTILLESGQTLQEYLDQRMSPAGNLYFPLSTPCSLFSMEVSGTAEALALMARGEDLSQQGGSTSGCGIPQEATAMLIQLRMESPANGPVRVKLWPIDGPEPAEATIDSFTGHSDSTMAVVPLSRSKDSSIGEFQISNSDLAVLEGQVVGYFRKPAVGDVPGGGISFYTESDELTTTNNLFGYKAGKSTTGMHNSFFGHTVGYSNTTGKNNSFFGSKAGHKNSVGEGNTFVGSEAGYNNTEGDQNSFFGESAGHDNTEGFFNAFFGFSAGSENTTGFFNCFFGPNAGGSTTTGNGNAFFGNSAGFHNINGRDNAFFGMDAGLYNTTGNYNSYFGYKSGAGMRGFRNSFFGAYAGIGTSSKVPLTGNNNSFFGYEAGRDLTYGSFNAFFGNMAGKGNTTGEENTFFGYDAGSKNISSSYNAYFGSMAGRNATNGFNSYFGREAGFGGTSGTGNTGNHNAFFGNRAGYNNTTGFYGAFFGSRSGLNNTTGFRNAFFGYETGQSNTEGSFNSFFGFHAGDNNTTGDGNAFFGEQTGMSNTTENNNSFFGARSNGIAGITNATAIGFRANVIQSNSLVLGSIAGENSAPSSVNVGIGTSAPSAPLHVTRADGKARILVEEKSATAAVRTMLELQNIGGARITLKNTKKKTAWIFSTNNRDEFYFSRANTTGSEILLSPNGRLRIGPGKRTVFDLDPIGNLEIQGDLTANGMTYTSDRTKKEKFIDIDPQQTLEKLVSVPITEWNFKTDKTRHIGPMAQDFYAAFGVGKDNKHLNPTDTAGVTMAAIQGLYQQNVELKASLIKRDAQLEDQLHVKDQEIEILKSRVAELEALKLELAEIRKLVTINRNSYASNDD